MSAISKPLLLDFVFETRSMLQAEKFFKDSHEARHFNRYREKKDAVNDLLIKFDEIELENKR